MCYRNKLFKKLNKTFLIIFIIFINIFLCNCSKKDETISSNNNNNIVITDMIGREVYIPSDTKNNTVASTYGVATPFLSSLKISDRVLACNFKNKSFYRLFDKKIINAKNIGSVSLDSEALASVHPSIYICKAADKENIKIALKLGIPAFVISAEVPEEIIQTYDILGKIFGVEDRANEIIEYIKNELKEIDKLTLQIPENKRVSAICMGSTLSRIAGDDMLQSIMIKNAGGISLADGINGDEKRFWANCGVEKIFNLNPDVIFVTSSAVLDYSMNDFYTDSTWSAMKAVKNKKIFKIPANLDSWDMPGPGFVLSTYYMMRCMYPNIISKEFMQEKVNKFYYFIYGKEFTNEEIGYEFE